MQRIADEQREHNRQTAALMDSYAQHRRQVTAAILAAISPIAQVGQCSLCILGSGNCNDIDAGELAQRFRRIDLVDVDSEAMHAARDRLLSSGVQHVQVFESDLSGLYANLDEAGKGGDLAEKLIQTSRTKGWHELDNAHGAPTQYDCVLSACVLSQIMASVFHRVETGNPETRLELITEIRRRHIAMMARALAPGGRGLLAVDFLSNDSLPELETASAATLLPLLANALKQQNFFTGCHPLAIHEQLRNMERLGEIVKPTLSTPWKWNLGPRVLAVAMLSFGPSTTRREAAATRTTT